MTPHTLGIVFVYLVAVVSGTSHRGQCISYGDCADCHAHCVSTGYDFGYCQQSTACSPHTPYQCLCMKLHD
uniref:Invertebrate defensins family profile domain-containing protein n=1 Tax=Magallana gigas TaxID=29159 RepID=K1S498_MAGGI